ncbi:glycosyltransferase family 4 protein [Chryseobacterium sp.]|uniref:glycosyltransferase family 4 protein n=1 Tax=Chryseobacterium sp. TaxID=1871047 RepID=UPI0011CAD656|nr:glycosyltransferase family 4 protein [Chryseobacterium sp.]TXF77527.1 glycosyltransferase family 4 protein [Chryseobacterium sp.]
MSTIIFFMENYVAGGLDKVCRDILLNVKAEKIYLIVNKKIDERILNTQRLPSRIHIFKYRLLTPADLSNFATQHKKKKIIYLLLKLVDYLLRYPLLLISFVYFFFYFRKLKYDCFMTHNGGYPAALFCGTASFASALVIKRKSIFVFHSMPRKYSKAYIGFDYIWDRLVDRYCIIVSVSKKSAIELLRIRKIFQFPKVIHNGIDPNEKKINTASKEINILHIGYVSDSKNQLMLLKTLNILVNNFSRRVKITFVGDFTDDNYKKTLDDFLINNHLEDYVSFEGFKENMELYYSNNDILVCTSKIESFPMVILEAMRIGMPVVSTNVGGIAEQIEDGCDGFLVNSDDYTSLADKIQLLFDANVFENISKNAYKSFNNKFTKNRMIESYNEILNL